MKKLTTIAISGKNFQFTKKAFIRLNDFDKFLRKKFNDTESLLDIEVQVATLLELELENIETFVDEKMIQEAIHIVNGNEKLKYSANKKIKSRKIKRNTTNRVRSPLYRNKKGAILGGVCAGFADKLNVSNSLVRLIVALLIIFVSPSLLIYIILWVILPKKQDAIPSRSIYH